MRFAVAGHYPVDRRTFLVAGGLGFFSANLATAAAYAADRTPRARRKVAKSAIMIWLGGGASHIDTWDMKAGVPFVTVFWKGDKELDTLCKSGGGWDTRPFAALLDDLCQRGLLETTLVLVTSEMGRKPKIGDPRSGGKRDAGRDHWTACMSVLLAGGGIRGGQVFGTSDKRAEYPADNPVAPEHIARTVFHAMGIDELTAVDREGRPFHLLEEGRTLTELF